MDNTKLQLSHSVNHPSKNRVLFFLSKTGGSTCDTCWVLDYTVGFAPMRYLFYTNFGFAALAERTNGTYKPYIVDFVSDIFDLDSGVADDQGVSNIGVNDYIVTGDVSLSDITRQNSFLEMHVRGVTAQQTGSVFAGSGTGAAAISYYIDGQSTAFKTDTLVLSPANGATTDVQDKTSEIRQAGKSLRVKIGSNDKTNDSLFVEQFVILASGQDTSQNSQ